MEQDEDPTVDVFVEVRGWSGRNEAMRVLDEARTRWPGHTELEPWPR